MTPHLTNIQTKQPQPQQKRKRVKKKETERKQTLFNIYVNNPYLAQRELNQRHFTEFIQWAWPEISQEPLVMNWHIHVIANILQKAAEQLGQRNPKFWEWLIFNVPPSSSKTSIVVILFNCWVWTKYYWVQFISASYAKELSLESSEKARDLIRSDRFKAVYPELSVKDDKDVKSNFKITKTIYNKKGSLPRVFHGGSRFSTSVGGSVTGFHGHVLLIDDPLNPEQAVSTVKLRTVNRWMDTTLPSRIVNREIALKILIMQRLHEDDPTGHLLSKQKSNILHVCIPGEILTKGAEKLVKPQSLLPYYKNGVMDNNRLPITELKTFEKDLGQYGYAGQVLQNPIPPQGGMFKVDRFIIIQVPVSDYQIVRTVRYWDKAGTASIERGKNTNSAFTVGVKMSILRNGKFLIWDVKRGRWSSEEREQIMLDTAKADGREVEIYHEQEPGSGGKQSAQETNKRLAGFVVGADKPVGDKVYRADPYSVQVNEGNILLLNGEWVAEFKDEHAHFPFSKFKDQVDAGSGAFSKLVENNTAGTW